MAEDQDDSQKTEEPSSRKLSEARQRGQVPSSMEIKHGMMLLGTLILILALSPIAAREMAVGLSAFLSQLHAIPADGGSLIEIMQRGFGQITLILLLPLVLLIVMGVAGTVMQTGWLFSTESLRFDLAKISPIRGMKRLFSMRSVVELVKSVLKIAVVGAVAVMVMLPEFDSLEVWAGLQADVLLELAWSISVQLTMVVVAVVMLIAILDYLYQRWQFMRDQRMTKQEVMDEQKQSEGDPKVKAKLRQIRMQRARRRMMAAVPTADVVVTNPTHVAVAMQYDPQTMSAPRVVAKGADHLARRIRELAEEHDIMVVENPPLARALYQTVEIDQEVPPEHYKAVAEVIAFVFRVKRRPIPQGGRAGATAP